MKKEDVEYSQEWYNDLLWRSCPEWRKEQLRKEKAEAESRGVVFYET